MIDSSKRALELADLAMAIDLASNLEPFLTQMCRVSYNNNNNMAGAGTSYTQCVEISLNKITKPFYKI